MSNKFPLVSVIVPSYNHELYIKECIVSILNQTYPNIELIVIDDGSKDNSRNILSGLCKEYKFKYIKRINSGLAATLNEGIFQHANGKYISICASDDFYHPSKLENQVNYMENFPDIGMVYGKYYFVDAKSEITKASAYTFSSGRLFEKLFTNKIHIHTLTALYKKKVWNYIGPIPKGCITEDKFTNLKISESFDIHYIDDFFSYYRRHNFNMSIQSYKLYKSSKKIIETYKSHPLYNKALEGHSGLWFYSLAENHPKEAMTYLPLCIKSFQVKFLFGGLFFLLGIDLLEIYSKSKIFFRKWTI